MLKIFKDLNEAVDELLSYVSGGAGTEEVFILDALERVCAEDVRARFSVPPFDTSAMDGFAVSSADMGGGRVELAVIGEAAAGSASVFSIRRGEAVKIMTGAPLPEGADAILVKEAAEENAGGGAWSVTGSQKLSSGLHVRRKGADFAEGEVIVPAGAVLNPAALGILASAGVTRVKVFTKRPVAVVSTGDELIDPLDEAVAAPDFAPGFGRIMNSNAFLLYGLLSRAGLKAVPCGIASDTPEAIASKIGEGLARADVVVTTGGASVGSYDYIPDALRLLGFDVGVWKMAIKPGRPFIFGLKKEDGRNKLAFGLPGNPASALVSFVKLLRPAFYKYAGRSDPKAAIFVNGVLGEAVKKDPARTTFLRARIGGASSPATAYPVIRVPLKQDSNVLTTALYADCLAEIPAGEGFAEKGEIVSAQII